MTEDKLLHFNPLIAKAFTQFESENDTRTADVMREIVIAGLKTGAAPRAVKVRGTTPLGAVQTLYWYQCLGMNLACKSGTVRFCSFCSVTAYGKLRVCTRALCTTSIIVNP